MNWVLTQFFSLPRGCLKSETEYIMYLFNLKYNTPFISSAATVHKARKLNIVPSNKWNWEKVWITFYVSLAIFIFIEDFQLVSNGQFVFAVWAVREMFSNLYQSFSPYIFGNQIKTIKLNLEGYDCH